MIDDQLLSCLYATIFYNADFMQCLCLLLKFGVFYTHQLVKGVVQNCHHFSREYIEYARGQWSVYFMNVEYNAGSLKINIFKVLFWEGGRGSQKEYSVRF